uniref:Uncharacterized protein n=1 Tax=Chrysotila carterae TaxID=13221 RepID=A0A7S4ETH3_CHRCT
MTELFRYMGKSPALVARTPKLLKYKRILRPHRHVLARYCDALAPHLPRILDEMETLAPYIDDIFEVMPSLLPYLGLLLDELPYMKPYLPMLIANRQDLLAELPYMAPKLKGLRAYHDVLCAQLSHIAPHMSRLAPHMDELMPHMPLIVEKIDQLIPHIAMLTQEEALQALLPEADELLRCDLSILSAKPTEIEKYAESNPALKQLHEVISRHAGAREASPAEGAELRKSAPRVDPNAQFWENVRRSTLLVLGFKPKESERTKIKSELDDDSAAATKDAETRAAALRRVNDKLDEAEAQLKLVEKHFVAFKQSMHWRQQKEQDMALRLAAAEGGLIEVEDGVLELQGRTAALRSHTEAHARALGPEAIKRGREKLLITSRGTANITRDADDADAKTDSFLWSLPL